MSQPVPAWRTWWVSQANKRPTTRGSHSPHRRYDGHLPAAAQQHSRRPALRVGDHAGALGGSRRLCCSCAALRPPLRSNTRAALPAVQRRGAQTPRPGVPLQHRQLSFPGGHQQGVALGLGPAAVSPQHRQRLHLRMQADAGVALQGGAVAPLSSAGRPHLHQVAPGKKQLRRAPLGDGAGEIPGGGALHSGGRVHLVVGVRVAHPA